MRTRRVWACIFGSERAFGENLRASRIRGEPRDPHGTINPGLRWWNTRWCLLDGTGILLTLHSDPFTDIFTLHLLGAHGSTTIRPKSGPLLWHCYLHKKFYWFLNALAFIIRRNACPFLFFQGFYGFLRSVVIENVWALIRNFRFFEFWEVNSSNSTIQDIQECYEELVLKWRIFLLRGENTPKLNDLLRISFNECLENCSYQILIHHPF